MSGQVIWRFSNTVEKDVGTGSLEGDWKYAEVVGGSASRSGMLCTEDVAWGVIDFGNRSAENWQGGGARGVE